MGKYLLDSPMIIIEMGGVDVVLGVQWLQSLGTMDLNFQELLVRVSLEGKKLNSKVSKGNPLK
jgi:hypothetical protein